MHLPGFPIIYAALISVSFLWGTSFAAAKIGMYELAPLNLVTVRCIIASLLMGSILLAMREGNTIERRDIPKFILLGFIAITSYFYIQYTGLQYTTTINASLLIATSPVFTALISAAAGWDVITRKSVAGIALAFIGVCIIITNGRFDGIFQSSTIIGDFMLLVNAIVWASFTAYGKTILQKYRPFVVMAYVHIFGTLLLLPFALFPTPLAPVSLPAQLKEITWTTVAAALYLAVLCSVYAYFIWYTGVDRIGAVRTSVFSYLNPVFAIITGICLMGETVTVYILAGGFTAITGVYLTNRRGTSRSSALPPGRFEISERTSNVK
jgi:drug/metabolite transporter (DMT)-like permease